MSVTAFSIVDGDTIEASNANYETYRDKLPVCGTCFGEICLARGEHKRTYWRHFPGVGIDCPDRSDIKSVVYKSIKNTSRKQSLALFRQRFLEILDIDIQPTVSISDTQQTLSFREPIMYNIAKLLPIKCNDRSSSFDTVIFEIYGKHRKRTDIITDQLKTARDLRIKALNDDLVAGWKSVASTIELMEQQLANPTRKNMKGFAKRLMGLESKVSRLERKQTSKK
ncbi:hypothetical protein NIES4071_101580 (plasmid) [Calothrix sp. NIES-4071]|nr:hypothetical protein NIES4071_101580 [Calothrix sp. NIES-4071]BAZ64539.1 hypothetical protein NIES4105_102720 [Calothrix sp. NIES-4105]